MQAFDLHQPTPTPGPNTHLLSERSEQSSDFGENSVPKPFTRLRPAIFDPVEFSFIVRDRRIIVAVTPFSVAFLVSSVRRVSGDINEENGGVKGLCA